MIRVLVATAALALTASSGEAAPRKSPAPPPMNPAQAALASARLIYLDRTIDQFRPGSIERSYEGQAFHIEASFADGESLGETARSGYWTYKKGHLEFVLHLEDAPGSLSQHRERIAKVGGRLATGHPYVGETGLGVRRRVTVENWNIDAIAFRGLPTPDEQSPPSYEFPNRSNVVLAPEHRPYWVDIPIEGDAARRLTQNVRVVIEGKIARLDDGELAECAREDSGPEVDAPTDVREVTCWVGAAVTRVAFVDRVSGQVLKQWETHAETTSAASPSPGLVSVTAEEVQRYFPDRAQRLGVSGSATVSCHMSDTGVLTGCTVAKETPGDQGFGDAVLAMMRGKRGRPAVQDSRPVASPVSITVDFKPPL